MSSGENCLFCKIVRKELPADVVLDEEDVLAFNDANPAAPTHVLVIPKEHLTSLEEVTERHGELLTRMVGAVNQVARAAGVAGGYRVVTNVGRAAGQSIGHLHLHVLGGRTMSWPPG